MFKIRFFMELYVNGDYWFLLCLINAKKGIKISSN
jgi:hypothetical protein